MPKGKKKSSNKRRNSRSSSETSGNDVIVPPMDQLLSIESVMHDMFTSSDVDEMLQAGQWILKPKCKKHKVYYRYVLVGEKFCKQSVTHSCTSGKNAYREKIHDLTRPQYTSDGGVNFVVNSTWVRQNLGI